MDLRGHGESSVGWASYTRTDLAGDLIALVKHLGGPAILVGHSIAGGAVTIAAAKAPDLVTALVELAPFTRKQQIRLGDFRVAGYRRGATHLMGTTILGSTRQWAKYLDAAYPGPKPADWDTRMGQITAMLEEPGRMKVLQAMGKISPSTPVSSWATSPAPCSSCRAPSTPTGPHRRPRARRSSPTCGPVWAGWR